MSHPRAGRRAPGAYNHGVRIPFIIWVAGRYLRARVRQSVLTISGVALGVTIVTLMQSYMGGFLAFFIARALQSTPSVTVTETSRGLPNPAGPVQRALGPLGNPVIEVRQLPVPSEEEALKNPREAETLITRLPDVAAVSPFVNGQGLVLNGALRQPVSFIGIRPLQEARVTDLRLRLLSGTPEALAQRVNGIILGRLLAQDLDAEPGSRITIISQQGVSQRFQVVGIYSSQLMQIDQTRAYINLRAAQQLAAMRGISGLGVRTRTLDIAAPVARRIARDTGYTARTWREVNAGILDLFNTISAIIYLIVSLTMVVAGFGIANALMLTVNEKRRDIGVLKAMGTTARQIAGLFITTGTIIAVTGVVLGEVLGALGILAMLNTPIPIQPQENQSLEITNFPMLQSPRVYLVSAVFGMLVSILASVLPSRRAARSDPVEVIRSAE